MTLRGTLEATVADDRVRFRFDVTNDGEHTDEITFPDAGKAEFVVERADGDREGSERENEDGHGREKGGSDEREKREHWRYSDGRTFAQVLETERLEPGESSTYEGEWKSPDTGRYVVRATLRARERAVETTCEFSVES